MKSPVKQTPKPSSQEAATESTVLRTKPQCLKEFNPRDQEFVEALGKFVAAYEPHQVVKRFRIGLSREMFGDTCCWVLDAGGNPVCVPCDDAFAFVRGTRR